MDKQTLIQFLHWVDSNTFVLNNDRFFGKYKDYDFFTQYPISYNELVEKFYEMEMS